MYFLSLRPHGSGTGILKMKGQEGRTSGKNRENGREEQRGVTV